MSFSVCEVVTTCPLLATVDRLERDCRLTTVDRPHPTPTGPRLGATFRVIEISRRKIRSVRPAIALPTLHWTGSLPVRTGPTVAPGPGREGGPPACLRVRGPAPFPAPPTVLAAGAGPGLAAAERTPRPGVLRSPRKPRQRRVWKRRGNRTTASTAASLSSSPMPSAASTSSAPAGHHIEGSAATAALLDVHRLLPRR